MARALREAFTSKRRFVSDQDFDNTPLNRCIPAWSLCLLGVGGAAAGAGAHAAVGGLAGRVAGPALVLSFILAGVAAMLAGACLSEMSSRCPRAGGAHAWSRLVLGDAAGFLLGWTLLLDFLCGSARLARWTSRQLDALGAGWGRHAAPLGGGGAGGGGLFAEHLDALALVVVLVLGGVIVIGVRQSTLAISALTAVNLAVIAFIVVAGALKASISNWRIDASQVPAGWGAGGFLPYGVGGAVRGAAVCFWGYVGFDALIYAGEEARDARRWVPLSVMSAAGVSLLVYCALAALATLMLPYYLQESSTTIADIFSQVGWEWARWIVDVGSLFGISASLMSGMYALSRLMYSMCLAPAGYVGSCGAYGAGGADGAGGARGAGGAGGARGAGGVWVTPERTAMIALALVGALAAVADEEQLALAACGGTLLAYTVVAVCLLLLRYGSESEPVSEGSWAARLFGCVDRKSPSTLSTKIVYTSIILFVLVSVAAAALAQLYLVGWWDGSAGGGGAGGGGVAGVATLATLHAVLAALFTVMCLQPTTHDRPIFMSPMVPLIPLLSIYVNIHLMAHISPQTWIRLLIWILIGVPIYLVSLCCHKKNPENLSENLNSAKDGNGLPPVAIVVEPPTPVGTLNKSNDHISTEIVAVNQISRYIVEEEIMVHQAIIDYNEEKEARIIDLIDQVLQAEEDAYGEITLMDDQKIDGDLMQSEESNTIPYTKSLSELSDAGSELSISGEVLSKYDVIVQVHREDMPVLNEEPSIIENTEPDERLDQEVADNDDNENIINRNEAENNELMTCFNEDDTNSGTDESGYSDTTDINTLDDSAEEKDAPRIPSPPPMDENYFSSPVFKKSYTMSARTNKPKDEVVREENRMRVSVQSNSSIDDDNMVFGSERQQNFMSKLNVIFQTKMSNNPEETVEPQKTLQRSLSAGNLSENAELQVSRERPQMFIDLKKELLSRNKSSLRSVDGDNEAKNDNQLEDSQSEAEEESSLPREALKSKLENLFAAGGPKPFKKSNKSTDDSAPEDESQTDASSVDNNVPKLPKMDKNDTLKRQKTMFGEVLNSFRISLAKDDLV